MTTILIPYTYGDKVTAGEEIGPIGYFKCKKCKKMSLHVMEDGTLQKNIDGFIPAGRKRKSYVVECNKCGRFFIPKPEKEDYLVELAKHNPKRKDFEQIEFEVSEYYSKNSKDYTNPDMAIEQFPNNCVKAIAKDEPRKYQQAVFESATAFIYNKAWRKSTAGKEEKLINIIATLIFILIVVLIILALAGLGSLISNLSKK